MDEMNNNEFSTLMQSLAISIMRVVRRCNTVEEVIAELEEIFKQYLHDDKK